MKLEYKKNELHFGLNSWNLLEGAAHLQGPTYIYDLEGFRQRYQFWSESFGEGHRSLFAVKSNPHPGILSELASRGAGADVVSGGEIERCLDAGFSPGKIAFSGVGKTIPEIDLAITRQIGQINIESLPELQRLCARAEELGEEMDILVRVNPDVEADTHPYIATGAEWNKFGVDMGDLPHLTEFLKSRAAARVHLKGLSFHIGSQILEVKDMAAALARVLEICQDLKAQGFPIDRIDVGGGAGIDYNSGETEVEEGYVRQWGAHVQKEASARGLKTQSEPGRWISARNGVLLTQVQYVKKNGSRNFVIVDSGMHHLIRPALYEAYHRILPVLHRPEATRSWYEIVGPICESADFLGRDRELPEPQSGDWLAIADAGAYGAAMANNYNLRGLPTELII